MLLRPPPLLLLLLLLPPLLHRAHPRLKQEDAAVQRCPLRRRRRVLCPGALGGGGLRGVETFEQRPQGGVALGGVLGNELDTLRGGVWGVGGRWEVDV
jgi:hypothetical protein